MVGPIREGRPHRLVSAACILSTTTSPPLLSSPPFQVFLPMVASISSTAARLSTLSGFPEQYFPDGLVGHGAKHAYGWSMQQDTEPLDIPGARRTPMGGEQQPPAEGIPPTAQDMHPTDVLPTRTETLRTTTMFRSEPGTPVTLNAPTHTVPTAATTSSAHTVPTAATAPIAYTVPTAATAPMASTVLTPAPERATASNAAPARPAPSLAEPNPQQSKRRRLPLLVLPQSSIDRRTLLWSLLHLGTLGLVGTGVVAVVALLTFFGIIGMAVLGLGIFLLIGALYTVYAFASVEIERAHGLYGLDVPPLARVRGEGDGFGPFLKMAWMQFQDVRMWRSFLSFAVSSLLGVFLLIIVLWVSNAMFTVFAVFDSRPIFTFFFGRVSGIWGTLSSLAVLLLAGPAIIGLGMLQGVVVRNLAVLPSRASLNQAVQAKTVQREGAVRAADLERTRIERDLHDGVQPRLVSVAISLGMAQKKIDSDPQAAKQLVSEAHVSIKSAITELRQLARGIHPSVLDDRGLDAALSALAGRSHIPVTMDVRMDERDALIADEEISAGFRDAEAAVYFAIAESLTNAAKHSRASECRVVVRLRNADSPVPMLWARVEDNGVGGAEIIPGGGLDGICNRVLAAGGTSTFVSPIGGPTALEVSVPCAS